jgi:hypothetical protein
MNIELAYKSILYYCHTNNIEVVSSNVWSYDHNERIITEVWRGKPTKVWVYTMLHELGHALTHKTKSFSFRTWRISELGEHSAKDKVSAVQIMREEMEAWETGFKLAKRLNIQIERKDYDKYASECLFRYMKALPAEYEFWKSQKSK